MKIIPTGKWCHSNSSECFYSEGYDAKEDAIADCLLNYGKGYVGEIAKVEFVEGDISCDEIGHSCFEVINIEAVE